MDIGIASRTTRNLYKKSSANAAVIDGKPTCAIQMILILEQTLNDLQVRETSLAANLHWMMHCVVNAGRS